MSDVFKNISEWFKGLFSKIFHWIDDIGEPVVLFLEKIKEAVNNPALDVLVNLTSTPIDNDILLFLRQKLPWVIEQLGVLNDYIGDDTDVTAFVHHLQQNTPAYQQAMYHKTASLLAETILQETGGKPEVKRYETDTLVQISFDRLQKTA